jgi:class 3 adenylate cyclase/tetratricopeptide (TPR) repeat protein
MSESISALETVMFTDVRGSTELRTSVGDEDAHRRLGAVQETIASAIEDHRGRVIKTLGDGVFAAFSSPRQAVYCAVTVQSEIQALSFGRAGDGVAVRIGINTGEVVRENDDLFGEAVNAAARIAALADGDEVLVASVVKDLAGTVRDVTFVDRGLHALKGFPEEWRLFEVRATRAATVSMDKTPFVGRRAEMTRLDRHLEEAMRGRGSVVLIGGEPGVGKTRLAEELAAEARRRGAIVFTGSCHEVETPTPFAPFVDVLTATARTIPPEIFREIVGDSGAELARFYPELRAMFPDIPEPIELPAEQERRYTFNSIGRYVSRAAAMRPLMLILDDLHWADEATLQLLQHLATVVSDLGALLVGTYRDVELAVSRPLARTLEHMIRQRRAHRIALKRLSQEDVAAMLQRLAGSEAPPALVEVIYSETDGNAFFVEEVFRHLLEDGRLLDANGSWRSDVSISEVDVPEGVRLVTGRRIERLAEGTRDLLTLAAVIGRVFEVSLLEAAGDRDGSDLLDALDEAERARLIEALPSGREARYQFVHELVRQTLLADVSLPRRQRLHLGVAQALEKAASTDEEGHVADLAHHLYQAGAAADLATTVKSLIAAGDRAQGTGGSEEALRAYERALSLTDRDQLERARLLYKMARSLRGLHRWNDALAAWTEALDVFEKAGSAEDVARVCSAIADRHTWVGQWQAAVDVLERGLQAQPQGGNARGLLLARQGGTYSWLGDHAAALDRVEQAEILGRDNADQRMYWTARSARVIHHWCFNQHPEAVAVGLETADVLRAAGALWGLATVLAFVQFSLVVSGRWDEAEGVYAELSVLAEQVGHPSAALFGDRWNETLRFLRQADIARYREAATRDLQYSQSYDMPWVAESYAWLGNLEFMTGDLPEAVRLVGKAKEVAVIGAFRGAHHGQYMMMRAYSGDASVSRDCLAGVLSRSPDDVVTLGIATETLFLVEALIAAGDIDGLAQIHDHVEVVARRLVWRPFSLVPTGVLLAACKAARGEVGAAREAYESCLREVTSKRAVFSRAHIASLWGKTLTITGHRDEAEAFLADAVEGFERIGATGFAQIAHAPVVGSRAPQDVSSNRTETARWDFVREGEFWTIGSSDAPARLKDTTGLRYLAELLANPGREIKALELAGAASGAVTTAVVDSDAGEVLDDRAKEAYRERISELEAEIAEATEWADEARVDKLRAEFDALVDELGRATGLGGRDRRAASTSERARVNVTKAIRAAIKRIEASSPAVGGHLNEFVRTGTTCIYLPDPDAAPLWNI